MPIARKATVAKRKPAEPVKPAEPEKPVEPEHHIEPEEQVNLDRDDDGYGDMEEEVEYEEVEEEEEEVEEEELEADEDDGQESDVEMKVDEDESEKQAELLTLPPHGSEVYIGGINHDASEKNLRRFCESVGEVTEVRLMKSKDAKENKGYAFVTFKTKELAAKAIKELNNKKFEGKMIKCSTAQAKHKLFIGNVPKSWVEADLRKIVTEIGPGINAVELVKVDT